MTCYIRTIERDIERLDVHRSKSIKKTILQSGKECTAKKWSVSQLQNSKTEVIDTKPPTYKLEDYGHEKIKGGFYEKEIQRVVKTDDVFKVKKVFATRKRKGVKEYFVKWKGYPEKFNSWIY